MSVRIRTSNACLWRTHLGLEMDTPQGRVVQTPDKGDIIEIADLGGLHHHYLRLAA
ncbi:MAG: hypothetical protein ACREXR_07600 [Gammaproteobacteria bacterium]